MQGVPSGRQQRHASVLLLLKPAGVTTQWACPTPRFSNVGMLTGAWKDPLAPAVEGPFAATAYNP